MAVRAIPILNADGTVRKWIGASSEIPDNKRSEQRFRRLYESNLVGIAFYGPEGALTDPNDRLLEMLGYSRDDSAGGGLDWRRQSPPEWKAVDETQWQLLHRTGRCGPFEKEFFRKDGSKMPVLVSAADLDPGNHDSGVMYIIDLTHLKKVERELRQTESNLRALNDSLERRISERTEEANSRSEQLRAMAIDLTETESRERKRLAQILHDHFQQLISAAKLKVGIARQRLADTPHLEILRQAESLLEEALNASRSLATELSPPVLRDAGLSVALEWLARRMERDHNLVVELSLDAPNEPDNEQVRTILFECVRELLFNVVKHSGVKQAQVSMVMPQEGLLQICVTDQGKGLNSVQAEAYRKRDGSFGLFSIKERLSLIGGLVKIKSTPGRGTKVQITVPVTLALRASAPAQAEDILVSENGEEDPMSLIRVLVADDHKLFREGLISLLAQEAYINVVGEAGDGEEAVAMARELRPDIMIVDVTMPKLSGVQVTSTVVRELPRTKIIGLSMHESDDMAKSMRDVGAVAYCTKGGPAEVLLSILRTAAGRKPATN